MSRKPAIIQFKDGTRAYLYARGWKCKADSLLERELNLSFPYPPRESYGYDPYPFGTQVQKAAAHFEAEIIQLPMIDYSKYPEGTVF